MLNPACNILTKRQLCLKSERFVSLKKLSMPCSGKGCVFLRFFFYDKIFTIFYRIFQSSLGSHFTIFYSAYIPHKFSFESFSCGRRLLQTYLISTVNLVLCLFCLYKHPAGNALPPPRRVDSVPLISFIK